MDPLYRILEKMEKTPALGFIQSIDQMLKFKKETYKNITELSKILEEIEKTFEGIKDMIRKKIDAKIAIQNLKKFLDDKYEPLIKKYQATTIKLK